ncbi:PIN-like domain-containing protein [Arthrobacter sp. UYCo732]|uniref:PIN-like domain-containing protein n=1 Tax=Arthrobacter sp. UYCo732 TaxID=3156336 RepID=UPI00339119F5
MSTSQSEFATVRSIYSDFVEYQNLDKEDGAEPVDGTIYAIDTNVLLNLYKYSRKNADEMIGALTKMSNVLFVPHQTLHEFWSRLEDVRKGDHHGEAAGKVGAASAEVKRTVETWLSRTGLSRATVDAASNIQDSLKEMLNATARLQDIINETQQESAKGSSGIIDALENILRGRVGPTPDPETRQQLLEVFRRRVADGIPPGNRDAELKNGKTDKAAGDFLIWRQCLDEARRRKEKEGRAFDLTLITNDLKDDWVRDKSGPRPLAHRLLLREYAEQVGGVFRIATFLNLLDTASDHFGATVSEEARAQVQEVNRTDVAGWTADSASVYLKILWNGYKDQLAVLLASYCVARDEAPPLTMDEARKISGRDHMAGFARPFKTVLTTDRFLAADEAEITIPMLSREFDEELNDYVYKLQGDPISALGEAIASDADFEAKLIDISQQIETIREGR